MRSRRVTSFQKNAGPHRGDRRADDPTLRPGLLLFSLLILVVATIGLLEIFLRYVAVAPTVTLNYLRTLAWPMLAAALLIWLRDPLYRFVDRVEAGEGPGFKVSAPIPAEARAAAAALGRGLESTTDDVGTAAQTKPVTGSEAAEDVLVDASRELVRSTRDLQILRRLLDSLDDKPNIESLIAKLPDVVELREVEESEELGRREQIEQLARQMALWGYQYGRSGGPPPRIEVTWHDGSPVFTDASQEDDIGGST